MKTAQKIADKIIKMMIEAGLSHDDMLLVIRMVSKCGETTEPLEEFEPDEDHEPDHECSICGKINDHELNCPDNHSPFANLIRDGYD